MTVEMGAKFEYSGTPTNIKRAEFNRIRRESGEEMAREYHSDILPSRFTIAGATKLKFGKRSAAYQRKKAKVKKHQRPLVWSGVSEQRSKKFMQRTIARGDNFRVEVTLDVPALNFKNPKSDFRPSDEIRRVASDEARRLEKTLGTGIEKRIKATKENRTVTV